MSLTLGPTERALVLGLGDADRGDEAVGVYVVRALASTYDLPDNVTTTTAAAPDLDLLDALEDVALLVAIDGVYADSRPGTVFRVTLDEYERPAEIPESLHEEALLEALGVMEMLGERPAGVLLVVQLGEVNQGAILSPELVQAVPSLMEAVNAELGRVGLRVEPRPRS